MVSLKVVSSSNFSTSVFSSLVSFFPSIFYDFVYKVKMTINYRREFFYIFLYKIEILL